MQGEVEYMKKQKSPVGKAEKPAIPTGPFFCLKIRTFDSCYTFN